MNRAVFLDRDGILLDHSGIVIAGVRQGLLALKREGFSLIVVTNQPDIATGKMAEGVLRRVNSGLMECLPLDDISVCPHDDSAKCQCRKPKAGMLLEAAVRHSVDLSVSWMVGDRWRDIGAGKEAGCRTILVGTGYGEIIRDRPDYHAADLAHAVDIILGGV